MPRSHRTIRRVVTSRRHLDLVPTITVGQLASHHAERAAWVAAQRYQTGPRAGQELAAARRAVL
jgi:hypothetical protein